MAVEQFEILWQDNLDVEVINEGHEGTNFESSSGGAA